MRKWNCMCQQNIEQCLLPKPIFIDPNDVPKSYKDSSRINGKFLKKFWSHALTLRVQSSTLAEKWIQKEIIKSEKSSNNMHMNALIKYLLINPIYFDVLKELQIPKEEIHKHFEYNIVSKTINVEILTNTQDMNEIYFQTKDLIFTKVYKQYLKNPKGIFKIVIYSKISENSKKSKCIGSYILQKKPEISKENNKKVYEGKLSKGFINNIDFVKNNKNELVYSDIQKAFKQLDELTNDELKNKLNELLLQAKEAPTQTTRKYKIKKRNKQIRNLCLYYSDGICLSCNNKAPFFQKNNTIPYLEIDHLKEFKDGGIDHIKNLIALCPNCHRKKTHWDNVEGKTKMINTLIKKASKQYEIKI